MKKFFLFFLMPAIAWANDISYKPEMSTPSTGWLLIVFLLALLLVALVVLKKKNFLPGNAVSNKIKLVEKQRLAVNTHAYLLEKEGVEYLIIDNGQHIAMQELSSKSDKV